MTDRNPMDFANSFLEAAPYLMRARGEHVVLWLDAQIDPDAEPALAEEIAILHTLGVQLSLIVGGAPEQAGPLTEGDQAAAADRGMARMRRWQDLLSRGWVGIADRRYRLSVVTGNLIAARRVGVVGGTDQGRLGAVRTVDADAIRAMHDGGHVVMFGGALSGTTGLPLWVPPLTLAAEYAARTRAVKLVLLTAAEMFREAPAEWSVEELGRRREAGAGGGAGLLAAAEAALGAGVPRVHAVDARQHGALLAELFSRRGSGVLMTRSPSSRVAHVLPDEVAELVALISYYEPGGALAPRSRELIEARLDDFRVLKVDGRIVACGALRRFADAPGVALIESVAVHPDYQGEGRGAALLRALEAEAAGFAGQVFAFTTAAEDWFGGFGYVPVDSGKAPAAIAAELKPERGSVLLVREVDAGGRPSA